MPNGWHHVHLGSLAVGGAGAVLTEATAVSPEGRISPQDTGIWSDAQAEGWAPITAFIASQGAVPIMQLAHAGRKGSTYRPWSGSGTVAAAEGGWETVAPSATPFGEYAVPRALGDDEIAGLIDDFAAAAQRALAAGFLSVEVHAAHGYLLHQFLSPLSNQRTDAYGGSFENRARLPLQVTEAVREVWPERLPLLVRLSATDWVDGGWDREQTVELARLLRERGVDLIDVSTAGLDPRQKIPAGPGFQVPFARAVRQEADIATAAVGLITDARQAEGILQAGDADVILMARAVLRNPHWPLLAAHELGDEVPWPAQYERARP